MSLPQRRSELGQSFAIKLWIGILAIFLPHYARAQNELGANPFLSQLFVGTCYQPVDRTPQQIDRDIALMKAAGFTLVRMGDLSWDAFEPSEGDFQFAWFDKIMDEMHANGIAVVLDISGLPAPIWLHKKYPGVDLVAENGTRLPPAERYMDDISDPDYRRLAVQFADALTKHYAHHPALKVIGFDNEIGNGFMSYSEADRQRFIDWLKSKYGSVETLNKAWATQRWSRHLDGFDEVNLPLQNGPGPSERYLDLHRYWSDVTIGDLLDLEAVRRKNIPWIPSASNLWDSSGRKGFDYLSSLKSYCTFGAMGFYPGDPVNASFEALMMKGDLRTPIWFNEFTAGGGGDFGTKGRSRMWAYLGLIDQAQTFLAWTFNSHLGGEEQALFGLLNHDNSPSWKLDEFARIAAEFKTLQGLGFPRIVKPQVAIAYSFDSVIASHPNGPSNTTLQYIKTPYLDQVHAAFEPIFTDNIDAAVINIGHAELEPYKLVIVAGDYLMDESSAKAIREYVASGGTVIMTGYSAKEDEHGNWFDTPLPGRLNDVFGLKTNEFYTFGQGGLLISFNGQTLKSTDGYYEVLEPTSAQILARFDNTTDKSAAITVNHFGKGQAIYLALAAQSAVLGPLERSLYASLDIERGPVTPSGVYARVVEGRTLYVNTTLETKTIDIAGVKKGIISGQTYQDHLELGPQQADLFE